MVFQQSATSPALPSPSSRKISHKKRKLGSGDPTTLVAMQSASTVLPTNPSTKSATCSSCHRAIRGPFAQSLKCARCKQEVCSICSRTCLGWPSSLALPMVMGGNPARSHPVRRSPLNTTQINTVASATMTGKRRKPSASDEEEPEVGSTDNFKPDLVVGCSRVVCRNCCCEAPHSQASMCYDCRDSAHAALQEEASRDNVICMVEV